MRRHLLTSWAFFLLASSLYADDDRIRNRVLIKLTQPPPFANKPHQDRIPSTGSESFDAMLHDYGLTELNRIFRRPTHGWANEEIAQQAGLDHWLLASFESDFTDLDAVLGSLKGHEAVAHCEAEHRGELTDTTPNDPDFGFQYSLHNGILNAPKAWDLQTDSETVVAVIDTGGDLSHQDLATNLWTNSAEIPGNGIDDDANGYVDDVYGWDFFNGNNNPQDGHGHGTHCSGIIGASSNNSRQISGICWSVKIMEVKAFSDAGAGSMSIAAASIVYAVENGARVLSNSYAFPTGSFALQSAVSYATGLDAVVVAAARNDGNDTELYPAAYVNVISVIATGPSDRKPNWSSYGDWCDLAAPGVSILSLAPGDRTVYLSGTSMAAPHVAGTAALVRAVNPTLDQEGVRWTLNYSAEDLGDPGFDKTYGWGRLDVFEALKMARSLKISRNTASPGDTLTLELHQPQEPGFTHILLASMRGRTPGISLNGYAPGDYRQVALNHDEHLFPLILSWPSTGAGIFVRFFDSFDARGRSTSTFHIPNIPYFANRTVDMAYLTFDPNLPPGPISSTSCSVRLRIQ